MSAFYVAAGERRYESTEHTRGPWSDEHQHAGPPAALLAREIGRAGGIEGAQLGRATFEILRPVPIAALEVEAEVTRPGRRVEMVEARMRHEGETLMLARAWRLRREPSDVPAPAAAPPPPPPAAGGDRVRFPGMPDVGWHRAMEIRFVHGAFDAPGPALAWFRMRGELVEGEPATPLDNLFSAADAGNGISSVLDFRRHGFVNTDLTVHLHREPAGEWACLDATTFLSADGAGMAESALHDERGPIGRALQTLLVFER